MLERIMMNIQEQSQWTQQRIVCMRTMFPAGLVWYHLLRSWIRCIAVRQDWIHRWQTDLGERDLDYQDERLWVCALWYEAKTITHHRCNALLFWIPLCFCPLEGWAMSKTWWRRRTENEGRVAYLVRWWAMGPEIDSPRVVASREAGMQNDTWDPLWSQWMTGSALQLHIGIDADLVA